MVTKGIQNLGSFTEYKKDGRRKIRWPPVTNSDTDFRSFFSFLARINFNRCVIGIYKLVAGLADER